MVLRIGIWMLARRMGVPCGVRWSALDIIRDFVSGCRVRYSEPFSTLFITVAPSLLLAYVLNPYDDRK